MIRRFAVTGFGIIHGLFGDPDTPPGETVELLSMDGTPRLGTVLTPYDPLRHRETYKVFTHLYDFRGENPLTKGVGGYDTHQRGLCIGWRATRLRRATLDTWHMKNCSQRARAGTLQCFSSPSGHPAHSVTVDWCDGEGLTFIRESRSLALLPDHGGARLFDFESTLVSLEDAIALDGDHHHAGIHVRLANEVCRRPWTVRFIIPRGARRGHDESVIRGWWICCHFVVRGKAYSLLHMTPPGFLNEPPVYSARAYGRVGAFFRKTLRKDEPFRVRSRIALSEHPLDEGACEDLYVRCCNGPDGT